MSKIKCFIKRFVSPELPMRLCVFNMMSVIGILGGLVSVLITYLVNIQNGQVVPMAVAVLFLMFLMYIANKKNKLDLAAFLLCIIIGFVVFPHMFIAGGGIYSGMTLWFVLVIVFDSILIEGKRKYILCSATLVFYSFLIYYAYKYPERIHYFDNDEMVFTDIGQSLIFVGVCILLIISFQLKMYDLAIKRAREAAEEAKIAKEEADVANAAKSFFLANMSHEIRTPMGVIMSMNEMIQRESSQENIIDYSQDVTAAAKSLLSIINDILDFSKIESGKMNIVEDEYDVHPLINDVLDVAKVKREETGLDFESNIDETIPQTLYGDDLRIKQCLINIISNAFKYTKKGQISLEINGVNLGEYEEITFSVKDTGIGIRSEDMDKLFSSFERLDETKNKGIQGTGLGLNITNRLLMLMGSKLEVDSTYGVGSRFYFTVKQKIIDSKPISEANNNKRLTSEEESYFTAPNANILVVDDSKMNLKVFSSLLKHSKINIDKATSGKEAIDNIRNKKYDLVFLDHMMPEMDGEETLTRLKEENLIDNIPVIMLTANAIVGMREHFLEVGFTDYLSKPIEYKLLEEMLINYLK